MESGHIGEQQQLMLTQTDNLSHLLGNITSAKTLQYYIK